MPILTTFNLWIIFFLKSPIKTIFGCLLTLDQLQFRTFQSMCFWWISTNESLCVQVSKRIKNVCPRPWSSMLARTAYDCEKPSKTVIFICFYSNEKKIVEWWIKLETGDYTPSLTTYYALKNIKICFHEFILFLTNDLRKYCGLRLLSEVKEKIWK